MPTKKFILRNVRALGHFCCEDFSMNSLKFLSSIQDARIVFDKDDHDLSPKTYFMEFWGVFIVFPTFGGQDSQVPSLVAWYQFSSYLVKGPGSYRDFPNESIYSQNPVIFQFLSNVTPSSIYKISSNSSTNGYFCTCFCF